MELFVADAFTTRRFSGNQAGVALLGEADFPEEGFMRALAGELKHSETAFVRRTGEGSFHIRYFTPAEEVDLCGHATIASFTVLRETGAIGPGTYALHTRSGDLSIQVGADAVWMDMAPPADGRSFSEEEQAELYAAYGLSLADRPEGLEAQAVSTGLLDILLPVRDLAAWSWKRERRISKAASTAWSIRNMGRCRRRGLRLRGCSGKNECVCHPGADSVRLFHLAGGSPGVLV